MERGLIKTSAGYIHYRATGQGRPIILLHAFPQSSSMFLELVDVLGKELRVFAIDYPSYGMSDHISWQPTISDYAKLVIEVMDELGVKKASFLGEATGPFIATELANVYPERVEKLIFVSCSFWQNKEFATMRHAARKSVQYPTDATGFPLTRTLEFVLEHDAEHIPLHPTQLWMDKDNVALVEAGRDRWQALNAVAEYDLPSNMERLQCPVLLIWGKYFFYLKFREEFTCRIKDHQILIINGGRFSVAWEHAVEVGQATLKFLIDHQI